EARLRQRWIAGPNVMSTFMRSTEYAACASRKHVSSWHSVSAVRRVRTAGWIASSAPVVGSKHAAHDGLSSPIKVSPAAGTATMGGYCGSALPVGAAGAGHDAYALSTAVIAVENSATFGAAGGWKTPSDLPTLASSAASREDAVVGATHRPLTLAVAV